MRVEANGTFLIDSALKKIEWERAKGHLRALVEIQGSYSTAHREDQPVWLRLQERVENFIRECEDDGLTD